MRELTALLLSDGRPGHYHLAEGVLAAIGRRRPLRIQRRQIRRRRLLPAKAMAALLQRGAPPALILRLGYGLKAAELPPADLVVSAGGDTIAANLASARALAATNIYCGTLKHVAPDVMSLVVSSYASHADLPNHVVTLKPNGMDPDILDAGSGINLDPGQDFGPDNPPSCAGLLIGGDSGLFKYSGAEWDHLLQFITSSFQSHGVAWIVSTSRRTPAQLADKFAALAASDGSGIADFIDFRNAGPGTLPQLFARAEVVLCSADSSTMISESVCARRQVVGFSPQRHSFKADERDYRDLMLANDWCRFLPLDRLTPDSFMAALGEVRPLKVNHLDRLADMLSHRLPDLF